MKRLLAIALLCAASTASAEPVTVKVVEVAGGVAYITPGRASGLVRGTKIKIRGRDLVVLEVTEKTASLKIDNGAVAVGDTGTANVDPTTAATVKTLPKPHAPDAFTAQWPDAVMPAEVQQPTPVPLGSGKVPGRAHVTVIGKGYGVVSGNKPAGDAEARVIASFDVMNDRPLAVDVDVAGRAFSGGVNSGTHNPIFVRAAQVRYGDQYDPRFALGRLRFAASSVGMLDGARAAMRFGGVELAAFGGLVPDPLGGKPDTSASRFGSELVLDAQKSAWQPRLAIAAYGSTWSGKLDERRLSLVASAGHDAIWVDGWAEAQQFPSGNPWNAKSVELTGAGTTVEYRKHGTHLGVDVNFLRPERSLRLAAVLPPEWLCTLVPQVGNVAETCAGSDFWASASASAGYRNEHYALDAVGTVGDSHGYYKGYDSSAYVRGEVRLGPGRLVAGGTAGKASFASWEGGEIGFGAVLSHHLDATASYRPELLDYRAGTGPMLIHSLVLDAHYAISTSLDFAASGLATAGSDRNALAVLTTLIWRPLP